MKVQVDLLRFLGYRTQTALSQGRAPGPETSVLKLLYGQHLRAFDDAGQAPARARKGMLDGEPGEWSGFIGYRFCWAPHSGIAGGTNEVQRNIIGERVLGLPAEPRPSQLQPSPAPRDQTSSVPAPCPTRHRPPSSSRRARRRAVSASWLRRSSSAPKAATTRCRCATSPRRANVALGTIYRYFSSKDHLLAAALVEWTQRPRAPGHHASAARATPPPSVWSTSCGRAVRAMEREPKLSAARRHRLCRRTIPHVSECQLEVGIVMDRIQGMAFPDDFDPELERPHHPRARPRVVLVAARLGQRLEGHVRDRRRARLGRPPAARPVRLSSRPARAVHYSVVKDRLASDRCSVVSSVCTSSPWARGRGVGVTWVCGLG